jgi:hypothetical protein
MKLGEEQFDQLITVRPGPKGTDHQWSHAGLGARHHLGSQCRSMNQIQQMPDIRCFARINSRINLWINL